MKKKGVARLALIADGSSWLSIVSYSAGFAGFGLSRVLAFLFAFSGLTLGAWGLWLRRRIPEDQREQLAEQISKERIWFPIIYGGAIVLIFAYFLVPFLLLGNFEGAIGFTRAMFELP